MYFSNYYLSLLRHLKLLLVSSAYICFFFTFNFSINIVPTKLLKEYLFLTKIGSEKLKFCVKHQRIVLFVKLCDLALVFLFLKVHFLKQVFCFKKTIIEIQFMINSDLFLENNGFFTKVMQIYSYFINQGYIS